MLKTISKLVDASQIRTPITLPGDVTLSTGNLVLGTAGKGIDFSADPSAAGMTSELLNDYEEGTWTPTLSFGGASTGITYTQQAGYYTKVGRQVTVGGHILLSSRGSSSGYAAVGGLPFTVNANSGAGGVQTIDAQSAFLGLTAGGSLFAATQAGNTFFYIFIGTATGRTTATELNFGASSAFDFQITYFV